MTERERFYIAEQKEKIMAHYNYTCQKCGNPARFLAHRIAQTKSNIKSYGSDIIHHWLNLVPVCSDPSCNDWFNIGFNPGAIKKLVIEIENTPSLDNL